MRVQACVTAAKSGWSGQVCFFSSWKRGERRKGERGRVERERKRDGREEREEREECALPITEGYIGAVSARAE